jgi:hypothetical protein
MFVKNWLLDTPTTYLDAACNLGGGTSNVQSELTTSSGAIGSKGSIINHQLDVGNRQGLD